MNSPVHNVIRRYTHLIINSKAPARKRGSAITLLWLAVVASYKIVPDRRIYAILIAPFFHTFLFHLVEIYRVVTFPAVNELIPSIPTCNHRLRT